MGLFLNAILNVKKGLPPMGAAFWFSGWAFSHASFALSAISMIISPLSVVQGMLIMGKPEG